MKANVLLNTSRFLCDTQCYYVITRDEAGMDIEEEETKCYGNADYEKELYMEKGTYYLHIRWEMDVDEKECCTTQKLTCLITAQYVERNDGRLGGDQNTASVIRENQETVGFCTMKVPCQVYKFTLNQDSQVTITAGVVSTPKAPGINNNWRDEFIISDNKGKQIVKETDVVERGLRSSISVNLNAGTYYFIFKPCRQGITNTLMEISRQPECRFSWKKVKNAEKYQVYMFDCSTFVYDQISEQKKTSYVMNSSKSVSGTLQRGKEYKFRVVAYGKRDKKLKETEITVVAK